MSFIDFTILGFAALAAMGLGRGIGRFELPGMLASLGVGYAAGVGGALLAASAKLPTILPHYDAVGFSVEWTVAAACASVGLPAWRMRPPRAPAASTPRAAPAKGPVLETASPRG
jgi:hypothetical protein